MFCLKTSVEALERLLIQVFYEEMKDNLTPLKLNSEALMGFIEAQNREMLDSAIKDKSTIDILQHYQIYQNKVRQGHLGKTAMFWMSFMDEAKLVFLLIHAVKTHNRPLLHKCNGEMANLFLAFNGQNYARYLSWFEMSLTNIELTHPGSTKLLDNGVIRAARSLIPGALNPIDKTMEESS